MTHRLVSVGLEAACLRSCLTDVFFYHHNVSHISLINHDNYSIKVAIWKFTLKRALAFSDTSSFSPNQLANRFLQPNSNTERPFVVSLNCKVSTRPFALSAMPHWAGALFQTPAVLSVLPSSLRTLLSNLLLSSPFLKPEGLTRAFKSLWCEWMSF